VGKTTLAIHLATWLVRAGEWVVLVDLDTQGSVARFLGLEPANDLAEMVRAVLYFPRDRRPPYTGCLTPVPGYDNLVVVRGWDQSARLESELTQPGDLPAKDILQQVLEPLLAIPRVRLILDTGPYAGVLQQAALALADYVIVPGIPALPTESGLLDVARRLRHSSRAVTGVVPTMIKSGTREHRNTIREWRQVFGPVVYYNPRDGLYGLPHRIIWDQVARHQRPIWDVAPRHKAAREMEAVVRRIAYDVKLDVG
jgi:chromosome partitioning protein